MIYHTNHHFGNANWNSYHGNHSYAGTNPYPTHSAQSYINKRHPARHSGIHRGWHPSGYHPEPPYNPQPQVPNQLRYSNYCLSRARCSTVKQLLDTYHGVTSSAPLMPPTHPPTLETTPALPQTADQVPAASSETPTACQYKPETSLNWEEQFVDLTSFCNSHIQMALIPDEEFAVSSQATGKLLSFLLL
ncbi:uncharacterized protein LOC103513377 isoform X3 [Diaphorina citri]|uniref:Uncharacterized protein LOC103513377 isoform X2 n=1 Tax=Diaphorina citri TaxID=121845 RepID=A0A3Q0J1Q2_DIACI|nr:uncharacterized protein LOC103513377 isoform X2 [Diaphorina citri]XP_026682394.1 uncharacterized protein LOC103513377 isoform X3 [Diaphorina citri]